MQRRQQRGQRTHSREPLARHALHDSNAFSRLSDITTEHPPALQHSMAPPRGWLGGQPHKARDGIR